MRMIREEYTDANASLVNVDVVMKMPLVAFIFDSAPAN